MKKTKTQRSKELPIQTMMELIEELTSSELEFLISIAAKKLRKVCVQEIFTTSKAIDDYLQSQEKI